MDVVKKVNRNGDSKKHRVLIEFDKEKDPVEYGILAQAAADNVSVVATMKDEVSKLVKELGTLQGYEF